MGDIMFGHPTIRDRLNEIHREIGHLANHEFDDFRRREEKVKEIRFRLLALLKTEEEITALIEHTLKKYEQMYGK